MSYAASSLVMVEHSSLRFIFGFLLWIQNALRVLHAEISLSPARIVSCTSKSTPLWACVRRRPRRVDDWELDFPSRCSLTLTQSGRAVSPTHSSPVNTIFQKSFHGFCHNITWSFLKE
ncbi:hypothetical protein Y032_0847g2667 [Ancylostoma ceylanicum]|uniref:Uncharacterized protein n=1 Tax=Ancylostoma ceylanicum TaxID=53326 RepID=A0A016WAK6_9BILA|nr:hypothetical protein Y032_0847g2667 [Ancylostoma ceylanicum]